jgi:hypothetical protein
MLYTCLVLVKNPPNPLLSLSRQLIRNYTLSLYWGISLYISPYRIYYTLVRQRSLSFKQLVYKESNNAQFTELT